MSDKKYKYVVVSGCSFSASDAENTPRPGETYGDLIAEHLGAKFYNLSISGTSLQHTSRVLLEWASKNKDKFKDTLVIVGKTGIRRTEIWNNKSNEWLNDCFYFQSPKGSHFIQGNKDLLINDWTDEERKNYFINFFNPNAQILLATNIIIGLQSFLTLNNIDHVFFDASESIEECWELYCDDKEDKFGHKLLFDNLVSKENWYKHPEYKSMIDFTKKNLEMRVSKEDSHPNKKAHQYWGNCLLEYIKN